MVNLINCVTMVIVYVLVGVALLTVLAWLGIIIKINIIDPLFEKEE